ncbi:hypothetical protein PoB_001015200 [Plakobranchus ocellatus]|uniref:Uncharacterized protein n=1 Tax=Plakobranchus ocellatus TaxID=259542 RepID=A0AAV3YNF0_9GAST|nr:hypothetical protein PoB_001015200 [Plakobranchus ocellatus]
MCVHSLTHTRALLTDTRGRDAGLLAEQAFSSQGEPLQGTSYFIATHPGFPRHQGERCWSTGRAGILISGSSPYMALLLLTLSPPFPPLGRNKNVILIVSNRASATLA